MNTLKQRLTSRRFWLALLTAGTLILSEQYQEAVTVVLAYLGFQTVDDTVSTFSSNKYKNIDLTPTNDDARPGDVGTTIISGDELGV